MNRELYEYRFKVGIMGLHEICVLAYDDVDADASAREFLDRRAEKRNMEAPVSWDLKIVSKKLTP